NSSECEISLRCEIAATSRPLSKPITIATMTRPVSKLRTKLRRTDGSRYVVAAALVRLTSGAATRVMRHHAPCRNERHGIGRPGCDPARGWGGPPWSYFVQRGAF